MTITSHTPERWWMLNEYEYSRCDESQSTNPHRWPLLHTYVCTRRLQSEDCWQFQNAQASQTRKQTIITLDPSAISAIRHPSTSRSPRNDERSASISRKTTEGFTFVNVEKVACVVTPPHRSWWSACREQAFERLRWAAVRTMRVSTLTLIPGETNIVKTICSMFTQHLRPYSTDCVTAECFSKPKTDTVSVDGDVQARPRGRDLVLRRKYSSLVMSWHVSSPKKKNQKNVIDDPLENHYSAGRGFSELLLWIFEYDSTENLLEPLSSSHTPYASFELRNQ